MLIIRWLGWAQTEIFQQHLHSQMTDVLDRGIGPANGQSNSNSCHPSIKMILPLINGDCPAFGCFYLWDG
jgi:hypothetical protein